MWNDELQVFVHSASFYAILGHVVHVASGVQFGLVCIYGDPYHRQTNAIWEQVANFVYDNRGKPMMCMGDLNDILYDVDICSANVNYYRMTAFRSLIKNCGFFDIGYSGPAYTWRNRQHTSNPIYQRLDRCLINSDWCAVYPNTKVLNLPIILSDHAPILISTDGHFQKPKQSFKFENWWLMEDDFQDHARAAWTANRHSSFSVRTKALAGSLKRWCKKKRPVQNQLHDIEEQIKQIQMKPPHQQDHVLEGSLTARYEQNLTKLNQYYKQRAKKGWAKGGDRNTNFFHKAVLKRKRRNTIFSIKDENDVTHFKPQQIANTFVSYFRYIFSTSNIDAGRPFLGTQHPPQIEEYTYSIPDKQEILQVLREMKCNASPGPDGFNVEFYLAAWEWIGDDVAMLVRNFYITGILPPHISDTNIALIPKKLVPLVPTDYRPISLCNVIYKIIAKTLANRLKPHLPDYIDPAQQAFIEGRRISDNIIIAQEIAHSFAIRSWKHQAFMLKIDLAKAFDRLEWNFIVSALTRKGLHEHFINLIYACMSSPVFSVIINGQTFQKFKNSRGIRQGCPLSPYLFVLAINELSLSLNDAMEANNLQGILLGPNCPSIHSLLFADDLLVCGQATQQEATTMAYILHHFCAHSGQTPNWNKSAILFSANVQPVTVSIIKSIFPVPDMTSNFTHLGHPLILPAKNRTAAYNFVLDKFLAKLPSYKANMLSHAARLELIRSVFSAIPVYYMSNILFTKKFIAKLTAIIRNFWWTGIRKDSSSRSLCLRAWKDICTSKQEGGLGIRNLQAMNQGLVLFTAWRIASLPNSHLHLILRSKYFADSSLWSASTNIPKSAFWTSILKMLPKLKAHSLFQITQGNISLWSTPWCSAWQEVYNHLIIQPSGFIYPAKVNDLWIPGTKCWNNDLINTLFLEPTASTIISTPIINDDTPDLLCWDLTPNGKCNSKSACKLCLQDIQDQSNNTPSQVPSLVKEILKQVWKQKHMAPRVQTFAWRLLRKALPTGKRASRFCKRIESNCYRCGLQEDDMHIFFACTFARAAWFAPPWHVRIDNFIQNNNSARSHSRASQ